MSRLYDRLTNPQAIVRMPDEVYNGPVRQILLRLLPTATCLNIDNVAAFYWQEMARADYQLNRWRVDRDFPNLAPPFGHFWMDFRVPPEAQRFVSEGCANMGALVVANEVSRDDDLTLLGHKVNTDRVRWLLQLLSFNDTAGNIVVGPHASLTIPVDKDGRYSRIAGDAGDPEVLLGIFDETFSQEAAFQVVKAILYPCLMAISFLHCKNVVVGEELRPRTERRRAERERRPLITFKTLDIKPIREILRREGGIQEVGLRRALHICRGHFATYTEDRPLFGRVSGTFWKPMHVRGSVKEGAVVKDYDVKRPANPGNQTS